ncbi:Uncharacterised protein [Serratia ficaria]|uniref:hypothetical protein n=1 Tax=Serratia ficaria TaxID=61651 RepID=UPI0021778073|nr:hypothetical protein [Serratia ficaria]CAI1103630.1 Uncharacterised protein [Serratia ficaria]CAI1941620.1 Uncharacterised protein [Serratia ficaria]CAI2465578.1 Uncharacterised protein [Serratia ficaria]
MTQALTTEQIEQVIDDCRKGAAMRGLFNKWIIEEMASELLRCRDRLAELSALANREAVPVYQCRFFTTDVDGKQIGEWQDMDKGFYDQYDPYCRRILYTAPPAPAVPDGFFIMPLTFTAANGAKGALSGEFKVSRTVRCYECGGEGCDDCADAGEFEEEITVPWSTIKEIYRAAVDACRSAMLAQPVSQGYKLNFPETPDG